MKRLCLKEQHTTLGAVWEQFGEWELPAHYGSIEGEVRQVRGSGGIIDRSFMARLLITGEDRVNFLQGMITNNIHLVSLEKGIHSLMVTVKGRIVADFFIMGLEEGLLLIQQPDLLTKVQEILDRYIISSDVQLRDVGEQWGQFSLHGPNSLRLLEKVLGTSLKRKEPFSVEVHDLSHQKVWIVAQQELGEEGFDVLTPAENAPSLWNILIAEGVGLGILPFGMRAYEILRIEAGTPLYGREMDETFFPLESGLDEAVSYDKGCYLGQETLTRMKFRGHANRHRIGFELRSKGTPKKGDPLWYEGKESGFVTSTTYSPSLNKTIGMACVRREVSTPGTRLTIQSESGEFEVIVRQLPFVGFETKPVQ